MADIGSLLQGFATTFQAGQDREMRRQEMEMQRKLLTAKLKADDIETQMQQQKASGMLEFFQRLHKMTGDNQTTTPTIFPPVSSDMTLPGMISKQTIPGMTTMPPAPAFPTASIPMASSSPTAPAATASSGGLNRLNEFFSSPQGQLESHYYMGFAPKIATPGPAVESSTGIYSYDPQKGGYAPITDVNGNVLKPAGSDVGLAAEKTLATKTAENEAEKKKNLPKVRDAYLGVNRQWDTIDNTIDDAIKMTNSFTAGPGSLLANVPELRKKHYSKSCRQSKPISVLINYNRCEMILLRAAHSVRCQTARMPCFRRYREA